MAKYEELICPRCNKKTLYRIRNKFSAGDKRKGSALKYQAKHCLGCNFYHGYSKEKNKETMVSLK